MKKRLFAGLLAAVMVATMMPTTLAEGTGEAVQYVAEAVDLDGTIKQYEKLSEALVSGNEGKTVRLLADITVEVGSYTCHSMTIDLNGHTLTCKDKSYTFRIYRAKNGDAPTVTITDSSGGNGKIINTNANGGVGVKVAGKDTRVTIAGAVVIQGYDYGLELKDGSSVTVENAVIQGGKTGVAIFREKDTNTSFILNNGLVEGSWYGIAGNGSQSGTEITINGGTVRGTDLTDSTGIFHPQQGVLTVTAGEISGVTGIEMRAGTLSVTGGEISGGNGEPSVEANGSGSTAKNVGIAVTQHSTKQDIQVTIEGTASISGSAALIEADPQGNEPENVTLSVVGGTFQGKVESGDCSKFISGGAFSESVKDYVADNKGAELNSSGIYTYYATVEEAKQAAKPTDTITDISEKVPEGVTNCTVTVVYDDGTNPVQVKTVAEGGEFILPDAPDRSGYWSFLGWYDGAVVHQAGVKITITSDTTFTAQWMYLPPIPPVNTYAVAVPAVQNGRVTASPAAAAAGTTVTLTVTPDAGHVLVSLTVMDGQGNAVAVQANPNGTYSFTMPASQVSVSAAFAPEEQDWVSPYSDIVKGEWYYDAVRYVTEQGLMNGVSAGSFAPTGTVTRGTLMTILARLNGVDTSAGEPWYQAGMTWAVANGVSDGTDPEGLITREQIAVMLYRAAGAPAVAGDFLGGFHDRDSVSPWAADAMNWAVSTGVIGGGDAGLAPGGAATRAELAAMLTRFAGL